MLASLAAMPGSYTGTFSVLGEADAMTQDILATQEFVINVLPAGGAPIPGPATLVLLSTGLAGVTAKVRRRRRQKNADA